MATPNYNYEKRQRELAKKKKKEDKLKEREIRKADPADFSGSSSGLGVPPAASAPPVQPVHPHPIEPHPEPKA
jgi:hypothetical protein